MKKKINPLDYISPENLFVFTGDLNKMSAVVELSKKCKVIYIKAQDMDLNEMSAGVMASIIYNVPEKTIEIRGRARFSSGRKREFSDKGALPYSVENLEIKKGIVASLFSKLLSSPGMVSSDTPTEIAFEIDEPYESFLKKMNDSGRFNIAVSSVKQA